MSAAAAGQGGWQGPAAFGAHPQQPIQQHQQDQQEPRPTVLVTTVDIGEGQAGRIELRLGDDPIDVARAFCLRHGLPDTIVLPLAQHLEDNLAEGAAAEAAAAAAAEEGQQQESRLECCFWAAVPPQLWPSAAPVGEGWGGGWGWGGRGRRRVGACTRHALPHLLGSSTPGRSSDSGTLSMYCSFSSITCTPARWRRGGSRHFTLQASDTAQSSTHSCQAGKQSGCQQYRAVSGGGGSPLPPH